jgi:hypothetical protein
VASLGNICDTCPPTQLLNVDGILRCCGLYINLNDPFDVVSRRLHDFVGSLASVLLQSLIQFWALGGREVASAFNPHEFLPSLFFSEKLLRFFLVFLSLREVLLVESGLRLRGASSIHLDGQVRFSPERLIFTLCPATKSPLHSLIVQDLLHPLAILF